MMIYTKKRAIGNTRINTVFLIALNLILMSILGFMTLDSHANFNSRFGGFLLSILMPYFIVQQTKNMTGLERMMKFGFGMMAYLVSSSIIVGIPESFFTGLLPCLIIALAVLFYGNHLTKK